MNTRRLVSTAILLSLTGFMGMFFTNCGEVNMDAPESQPVAEESDPDVFKIGEGADVFEKLSEHDMDMIGTRLDDGEMDQFRPLSDLNDPTIRDLYFCPSAVDKYLVCLVPEHLGVPAEEGCMSLEAVEERMDHEGVLEVEGDLVEAYDYLGPCKHEEQSFFDSRTRDAMAWYTDTH